MARDATAPARPHDRRVKPDAQTRICVLYGSEPMLMHQSFESLRDTLKAQRGQIDTVLFDGQSAKLADVLDELRSPSLLDPFKLVVVDAADRFVSAHREAMERYAQNPVDDATLVLRGSRWHRGKLDGLIEKVGCIIKCEPLSPVRAQAWLIERASAAYGCALSATGAAAMVDRLGSGLMHLDNELAKLSLAVEAARPITPADVVQWVGHSSEQHAWVVQEAVLSALAADTRGGGGGLAIEKIHDLVDGSGQAPVLVAYYVADLVRKLYLAGVMQRQGCGPQQISERLKLWGPGRTLFLKGLKRLDGHKAGHLFDRIIEHDVRAKTGRGTTIRGLECFCGRWLGPV